jgi:hypothetical protein
MITPANQRWHRGRPKYRPAGEVIATREYEVTRTRSFKEARAFVEANHYSARWPQASRVFELHHGSVLVGTAVFGVVSREFQPHFGEKSEWLTLARFILTDGVPGNGETWFLARCFELLRRESFSGVVSFSDPVPRRTNSGRLVFAGHVGTIYQAASAVFTGRTQARTKWLLPDGSMYEHRAAQKVQSCDQGADYAEGMLVRCGASPLRYDEDPAIWLQFWKTRLCSPMWHAGNLRYVFALNKRARLHLPQGFPYPKFSWRRAGWLTLAR